MPSTGVALKSLTDTTATIEGYAVIFGGVDLEGETFTKDTDFWPEHTPPAPPVLYDHGLTEAIGTSVIGQVVVKQITDVGLWIEAEINRSKAYAAQILELVKQGRLGWSTGAVSHLVEKAAGLIKAWPIAECSLTPTPCEPRTLGVRLAAKSITASLPSDVIAADPRLAELEAIYRQIVADERRTKAAQLAELEDIARANDAALTGRLVVRHISPADVPPAQFQAADEALKRCTALLGVKGARLRWWRDETDRDRILKQGVRAKLNREPWQAEITDAGVNGWVKGADPTLINVRPRADGDLSRLKRTVAHEVRHAQQFLSGAARSPTCSETSDAMESDAQEWAALHYA